VAAPIRIGTLDAAEADDLVGALAVRGLVGRPVAADGERFVELHEAHEETDRLVAEVTAAVEAWLADRGRPAVELTVAGRAFPVQAAASLDEALRTRLPSRSDSPLA
jgi:antitoxin (DNA-binding transcriptional repressor) of toxin-antitoxin stability system